MFRHPLNISVILVNFDGFQTHLYSSIKRLNIIPTSAFRKRTDKLRFNRSEDKLHKNLTDNFQSSVAHLFHGLFVRKFIYLSQWCECWWSADNHFQCLKSFPLFIDQISTLTRRIYQTINLHFRSSITLGNINFSMFYLHSIA